MNPSLKVGDFVVTPENIFAVLAEKQMIAPLAREIIIDQAIASIPCSQEEIATAERQFFQQIGINPQDKQQIKTWLEKNFLTREQLTERILRPIRLEKFKEQTWGQQVESYYLKRKSQLDRVVYSLIRTKNPGLAQELYFRLCEGKKTLPGWQDSIPKGQRRRLGVNRACRIKCTPSGLSPKTGHRTARQDFASYSYCRLDCHFTSGEVY